MTTDSGVASKFLHAAIFFIAANTSAFNFPFSALESQVQALHAAAYTATEAVNARGGTVAARLQDIPNCIQEIAGHGVHQGTAVALAVVQTLTGNDL